MIVTIVTIVMKLPIEVILVGIVKLVSPVHPEKTESPNDTVRLI